VLLLQGPVGPFFKRLADDLERKGVLVYKINFNGGDAFFFRKQGAIPFTGSLDDWPRFLEERVTELAIKRIYLFGDCRAYHISAREVAKRLGVPIFVFEEGYIRPDYITLEEEGVNGFSSLPRDPYSYQTLAASEADTPAPVGHSFTQAAIYAQIYYIASRLSKRYPTYEHHRTLTVWSEGSKWILSGLRKLKYAYTEHGELERLTTALDGRYFLVPLQVHCDMQLTFHSPFDGVEQFIRKVIDSFANHAPVETSLIFKHHPMDRGYRAYAKLIRRLAAAREIEARVLYLHDLPLPELLRHARGAVVINSTTGLSAIHHRIPVKVCGRAVYDIPGLTSQTSLNRFWQEPQAPDAELYRRFRAYMVENTQINGNFYKRLARTGNATGVMWPTTKPAYTPELEAEPLPQV
jgi:capsule polysaccharide modification protein KpsS